VGKKNNKGRAFRHIAEDVVQRLLEAGLLFVGDEEDITTSLVRQWLTYGGHAILFLDGERVSFDLDQSRPDKLRLGQGVVPGTRELLERWQIDWKIDPEAWPDIFDQLNRGQSAEVINNDGVALRLWVNPNERKIGVEPPDKCRTPPGWKPDYHKIAADGVWRFCRDREPDEVEKLIDSVVRQWQNYEGHACLFFPGARVAFRFTQLEEGSEVTVNERSFQVEASLASLQVRPEDVPEMIDRINLGQEIEFRNSKGESCRLWHNPKTGCFASRPIAPPRPGVPNGLPPLFCPECAATLLPWEEGQQQQHCPWCGQTVPRA
jgi:hypothetical protein